MSSADEANHTPLNSTEQRIIKCVREHIPALTLDGELYRFDFGGNEYHALNSMLTAYPALLADRDAALVAVEEMRKALEHIGSESDRVFETIRHYIHTQLGKPENPLLPSVIETSLDTSKSHMRELIDAALSTITTAEGG